jgi:hypothetical protein
MTEIEQELAALRHLWGGSYRIIWDGQFRAIHISTEETFNAGDPAELRMVLLAQYDQQTNARAGDC